ncbi:hypothetical protein [Desulfuromusa kysingii]|nr:hypothetical protein [Desulfuromusa kysingii]
MDNADHGWNGNALMARLNLRYSFYHHWYLQAEIESIRIESKGESKAYFSGVYAHTIDHEVLSHQLRSYLMLGFSC